MNQDAQRTYDTLCAMLDKIKWKYQRDDEKLIIRTSAIGKDLTMPLHIVVSETRNVMYTKSPLPFVVPQERRTDMSVATSIVNFSMLNGCFEFDMASGFLGFRIVVPFGGCQISEATCHYMVMLTCEMVDKFNDKFQKISKGEMSLDELTAFVKQPPMAQA